MTAQPTPSRRVALVTGASSGIGAATAVRLADGGFDMAVGHFSGADRPAEVARLVEATGQRAYPVQLDLSSTQSVTQAYDDVLANFGPPEVLANNAGCARYLGWRKLMQMSQVFESGAKSRRAGAKPR